MTDPQKKTYDPLERETFEAIAYSAVGRASEVGPYPAYGLVHSTGASGWSVGLIQWDMGQPNRGGAAKVFLDQYQSMAQPHDRYDAQGYARVLNALQTPGDASNLTAQDKERLNGYFRTDMGKASVDAFCQQQMNSKWEHVGKPLSETQWLQDLAKTDPKQVTEIVAMTTKLYNQGGSRGERLVERIQEGAITTDGIGQWLEEDFKLKPTSESGKQAYRSGQQATRNGAGMFYALEASDGTLGKAWQERVHGEHNPSLLKGREDKPDLQTFDMMFRDPAKGRAILDMVDHDAHVRPMSINPNHAARFEASRVIMEKDGTLRVESPSGAVNSLKDSEWQCLPPMDPQARVYSPDATETQLASTQGLGGGTPKPALSPQEQAIFETLRKNVPETVSDDFVYQATADLRSAGLKNADSIEKVALYNGAIFATSDHTAGYAHSKTQVEGRQVDLDQMQQQIDQTNQQQQQNDLAFRQQQQQAQAMSMG